MGRKLLILLLLSGCSPGLKHVRTEVQADSGWREGDQATPANPWVKESPSSQGP